MNKLKNIIKYIVLLQQSSKLKYVELVRVGFILYLIDWHSAVKYDKTITGIQWKVSQNHIEDSDEIDTAIGDSKVFILDKDESIPNIMKTVVKSIDTNLPQDFSCEEREVINRVLEIANERNLVDLSVFAFSTYPVISGTDEVCSDILQKASEYKKLKQSSEEQEKS